MKTYGGFTLAIFNEFTNMTFFSWYGLIAVIVIIIPNLLCMKKANLTKPDDVDTAGVKVCKMEFWSRFMLTFVLPLMEYKTLDNYWLYATLVILALYYIAWIKFAIGGCYYPDIYMKKLLGIPIPIDILNALYFAVVSIWLCNFLGLVLSIDYGVCRIINATKAQQDFATRI